jgi:hypothetical protein
MSALSQLRNWVSPPIHNAEIAAQVSNWNESYGNISRQVERFNQGLQAPVVGNSENPLKPEELDEIYDIISSQFKRLKEVELDIKAKLKELTEGQDSYRGKEFKRVLGVNVLTYLFTGAAVTILFAADNIFPSRKEENGCVDDNPVKIIKGVAYGCGLVGLCFEGYSRSRELRLNYKQFQEEQLKEIAAQGVDNARTIKNFIKRFRDLRKSNPAQDINIQNNFDVRISNCLMTYQSLPQQFRNPDVFPRVVSLLIEQLPVEDPIQQQMNAASLAHRASVISDANNPLPVQYLPSIPVSDDDQKWLSEAAPLGNGMRRPNLSCSASFSHLHANLKDIITQRFNLNPKHLPYIDTPGSVRIELEPSNQQSVILHSHPSSKDVSITMTPPNSNLSPES